MNMGKKEKNRARYALKEIEELYEEDIDLFLILRSEAGYNLVLKYIANCMPDKEGVNSYPEIERLVDYKIGRAHV